MQIYLVRHGQSTGNATPNKVKPYDDYPLTELGEQQAERLGVHLRDNVEVDQASDTLAWREGDHEYLRYRFKRLLCSPMQRALQTATPTVRSLELRAEIWPDLFEVGGLRNKGLKRSEIRERFPDFGIPKDIDSEGWWGGVVETRAQAHARAKEVVATLKERARDEWRGDNILLVGHGDFTRLLLLGLLNQLPDDAGKRHPVHYETYNTSIARVDLDSNQAGLRYVNRVGHLPPDMVTA